MITLILGNIFGFLSSTFLGLSVHRKSRTKMMAFQVIDCSCGIISCILLKGYNGLVSNVIGLIRNILDYKGKFGKGITCVLLAITVVFGCVNYISVEHTWYSLFPIIASVEYTLSIGVLKKYKQVKIAVLVNELLWVIYLVMIMNYAQMVVMIILCISTIMSLVRHKESSDVSLNNNM